MPVIMAGLDHRTVWRCTGAVLGLGFLHARCCTTCVLVQAVFYTVAFPQFQFFTVLVLLSRCVPFRCRQARVTKRLLAWTIAGSAVLGQVVLARRCTTPGAVCVRARCSVARGDTIGRPDMWSTIASLAVVLGRYEICWLLFCSRFSILSFTVMLLLFVAVCSVLGSLPCRSRCSLWRYKVSRRPSACLTPEHESVFVRRGDHRALHLLGETH